VGTSVPSHFAFDPTGRLLAVNDDPGVVRLVMAQTGKDLLRLTTPVEGRLQPWCFTPDGCKLIALGDDRLVHIFDLAAIRRDLRPMGLDWEDIAPPPPQAPGPVPPLAITVNTGTVGKSPEEKRKDREVIALRHFEQLSRAETAQALEMRESAVSKRYVRALERLKDILASTPGGVGEVWP
jgi:hypothetical protein